MMNCQWNLLQVQAAKQFTLLFRISRPFSADRAGFQLTWTDIVSACRLGTAGAGNQGAIRAPQRDDVSVGRRCPFVEPPRRGFVQMPEDHLADLAARPPPLAARDAVFGVH